MNQEQYEKEAGYILGLASQIETAKRPGYTGGNTDVLHNFKTVAERLGVTPMQAWAVYFLKHIDAIISGTCKPDLPVAEALEGRFADAINYLKLGWALRSERTPADTVAGGWNPSGTTQTAYAPNVSHLQQYPGDAFFSGQWNPQLNPPAGLYHPPSSPQDGWSDACLCPDCRYRG